MEINCIGSHRVITILLATAKADHKYELKGIGIAYFWFCNFNSIYFMFLLTQISLDFKFSNKNRTRIYQNYTLFCVPTTLWERIGELFSYHFRGRTFFYDAIDLKIFRTKPIRVFNSTLDICHYETKSRCMLSALIAFCSALQDGFVFDSVQW